MESEWKTRDTIVGEPLTFGATTVSPAEIDAFFAELCGPFWGSNHIMLSAPMFHASLDALFAPGGPVEKCRERGWRIDLDSEEAPVPNMEWLAQVWQFSRKTPGTTEAFGQAWGRTAAIALAEACYLALTSASPTTP